MPEYDDYGDMEAEASPSEAQDLEKDDSSEDVEERDEKESEQSGLLSKSFFGGKDVKPGATYKVRIDHVWEDEVECSLVNEDKESKRSTMDESEASLDRMAMRE